MLQNACLTQYFITIPVRHFYSENYEEVDHISSNKHCSTNTKLQAYDELKSTWKCSSWQSHQGFLQSWRTRWNILMIYSIHWNNIAGCTNWSLFTHFQKNIKAGYNFKYWTLTLILLYATLNICLSCYSFIWTALANYADKDQSAQLCSLILGLHC